MTRDAAAPARTATGPPGGEGRVPFTFRIGVTGHRQLADPASLKPAIRDAVRGLMERLLGVTGTRPALLIISALAEGADRLVATELLDQSGAELEAALPLPREDYLGDFESEDSKAAFTDLLDRASAVWQAPASESREEAYERAGRYVVDRADAVIALWDGGRPRGRGGTATVVAYARERGVPLAWVPATGRPAPAYVLDPQRAENIKEAARELREYNAAAIPDFPSWVSLERERLKLGNAAEGHPESLRQERENVAAWIVPYFVRADVLARRLERRFKVMSAAMFLAAAAAVTVVAAQVTFAAQLHWIVAAEVVLLLFLLGAPLISRRRRLLDRWISYRFLAERLRSGYFLALAGTGDRRERPGREAYLSDPSEAWISRALTEIMGRRPDVGIGPADVASLRDYLSDCWINGQIIYHETTARRRGAWENRLLTVTSVLFGITLVAAVLHLLGVGEHGEHRSEWGLVLVVLSICVPAIGAAVHGIRTQSQFRRHCQRSTRMAGMLEHLETDMSQAHSLERIREVAAETERLMREENNDWFGVMRFHDMELIT